jgi:hypothetical protein
MRRLLSYLLLLAALCGGAPGSAWAQRTYCRQFAHGAVLTTAGDTLVGRIELQVHADQVIVFRSNGTVVALPASRIRLAALKGERQYYLPSSGQVSAGPGAAFLSAAGRRWMEGGSFLGKHPALTLRMPYVWLDSTTVFLFRAYADPNLGPEGRPARTVQLFEQLSNGPYLLLHRQQLFAHVVETFYVAEPTGQLVALRHPKQDILALFPAHARQLEAFADQQHLGFTTAQDLQRLLTQANTWLP